MKERERGYTIPREKKNKLGKNNKHELQNKHRGGREGRKMRKGRTKNEPRGKKTDSRSRSSFWNDPYI